MPFDEIAERILSYTWSLIIEPVCHIIGFFTLRCITLGRYPPKAHQDYSQFFVLTVGFLTIFCLILAGLVIAYR